VSQPEIEQCGWWGNREDPNRNASYE